jgi:tetratricopeptide (TPR) repeat protein
MITDRDKPRDIDIAKPKWRRRFYTASSPQLRLWLVVVVLVAGAFGLHQLLPVGWKHWAVPIVLVLASAALIGGLVIGRQAHMWMSLARAPAAALVRGDVTGAERALAVALARARQFSPQDYRRGWMFVEVGNYLKQVGRFSEVKALFEEAVEILAEQWKSRPQVYLVALNNLAIYLMDVQDYAAAQRILEKVIDLTLFWEKGGIDRQGTDLANPSVKLAVHLNLIVLFMRMEELALATDHLEQADSLFAKLIKPQREFADMYRGIRALVLCAQGQLEAAAKELAKVHDRDSVACLSVRAKLALARGEFAQAEQLMRQCLDLAGKWSSMHRPDLREQVLKLAESLFGLNKYDEAFSVLEEARAITRDFALPDTAAWRKALTAWLQRAKQQDRTEAIASLEADLGRAPIASEHAITISTKLRVRPPAS